MYSKNFHIPDMKIPIISSNIMYLSNSLKFFFWLLLHDITISISLYISLQYFYIRLIINIINKYLIMNTNLVQNCLRDITHITGYYFYMKFKI